MERTGDEQNTASLRWVALRQEGPGAVPQGKECRALTISDSETEIGEGVGELGTGGGANCGCLDSIAFSTSVVEWAMPAEERYWMALRYWPSTAGTAHLLRVRDRGGSVGWRIRMWPCGALSKLSIGS